MAGLAHTCTVGLCFAVNTLDNALLNPARLPPLASSGRTLKDLQDNHTEIAPEPRAMSRQTTPLSPPPLSPRHSPHSLAAAD